ncbi:MAG: ABC transporter ATP-binding protein [Chloroflexi bacterium]|nr:ABC transporter ATP-binding protein [Chloroflexota bacterium]
MIEAIDVTKIYIMGEIVVHALRGVSLTVERGEIIAIMGPSGSGKSTFMNVLGALDRPTSGTYSLNGQLIADRSDDELALIRNKEVGFIFQTFNLLGRHTALSNVELPMRYAGVTSGRKERAIAALEAVGLGDRIHHRPNELSGGEQQRVAIARALVNDPAIILADEPTGNLDSKSGSEILDLLHDLNQSRGTTLIFVTHDSEVAARAQRIIRLLDGKIVEEIGVEV